MADKVLSGNTPHGFPLTLKDMGNGTYAEVVASEGVSNITGKFREAFEVYDPVNGDRWTETKAAGDLVFVDGNAVAASYLVISKSPLSVGETSVELRPGKYFRMPAEISIGAHMSQRTLGQEFSIEVVDVGNPLDDVPDLAISAISQAASVLTIDFAVPHGLVVGKSVGIYGCSDPRANYPALAVASAPTPTQITCTAGPGAGIPSLTIANPSGAKGYLYFRERLGRAKNGVSMIFENATVTNASLYVRSESGDVLPGATPAGSHSSTVGTTASIQAVNSPYMYAFAPTTEFRLLMQADRIQWADSPVDTTAQMSSRLARSQVCPDPDETYKLRIRATNNKGLTVPVAQIVTATKTGTTIANIVTDRPHGLAVGDPVVQYGTRAQGATEFPNLTAATAVLSIVSPTEYTITQGTAGTITSYGGYVAKVNGGNLMSALGASAVVAQSAVLSTLADGTRQLVLTGYTNWSGLLIGDLADAVGVRNAVDGATLGLDGPWKVANVVTSALTLVLPYADQRTLPADFGSVNCGGGIIKRTDLRLSFVRVFDYERLRVEALARPSGDSASAAPVTVQGGNVSISGTPAVTLASTTISGGQAAHDAAVTGNPMRTAGRAATANYAAVANGDTADIMTTTVGAQVVRPHAIPEAVFNYTGALTSTTDVAVQAAAGAGLRRHPVLIDAHNSGAADVDLILSDGTTVRQQYTIKAGTSKTLDIQGMLLTTANTALNAKLSATGTVRLNMTGYTAP